MPLPPPAAPDAIRAFLADAVIERVADSGEPVVHRNAAVIVEAGTITAIAPQAELGRFGPGLERVGGPGQVLVPGFVNAHHHVGTTPFQLGAPDLPLELWFAARLALRDVDLRLDTLISACEMIASGVTTVQHLHSRVAGGPAEMLAAATTVLDAYREIGLRASYSLALRDQNRLVYEADADFVARLPEALRPAMAAYFARFTVPLADQVALFRALRAAVAGESRLAVQLAPANLHWLSDTALETAAALSAETGAPLHIHLVETPYQRVYARRRTGGTAFRHIESLGLAGPRLTIGHGVWMSRADIARCAATGTRLCHNCASNFRLASGVAPVGRFVAEGVPVALGIDEAGLNDDRDMLQEMRLVLTAHRRPGLDTPQLTAAEVLRMATEHGAGTTPFGPRIGTLSPGAAADMVAFDWAAVTAPWQDPDTPLVDVLVRRARPQHIAAVHVAGETLYAGGRFTRIDKPALDAAIAAHFGRPASPAEIGRRQLAADVMPHVRRFYAGWIGEGDLDLPVP